MPKWWAVLKYSSHKSVFKYACTYFVFPRAFSRTKRIGFLLCRGSAFINSWMMVNFEYKTSTHHKHMCMRLCKAQQNESVFTTCSSVSHSLLQSLSFTWTITLSLLFFSLPSLPSFLQHIPHVATHVIFLNSYSAGISWVCLLCKALW